MSKTFTKYSPTPGDTKALDREIAHRLRARRRQLALTQQDLAASMKLSYQQIQKYESGTNRISSGRLFLLAKALGVKPIYFFHSLDSVLETPEEIQSLDNDKVLDRRVRNALNELVLALTK